MELPLLLLKYFVVLSCSFPVDGKTRALCRTPKMTILQIWSTGSWVLFPKSQPKIFWDSMCMFPKEGVKVTASMRQFSLLRTSQIQWAEVITCHITWGHQMPPGIQALPVHRAKEELLLPCSIQNVLEKQWVFSWDMYMVPMWWGSLHPFGLRVYQNRQILRVRCYQQAHYQTPQKSSCIYKPLTNYLSNSLVWGVRKHTLTIGLVRNLTWALAYTLPHVHTLDFQGNGQGRAVIAPRVFILWFTLICELLYW